MSLKDLLEKIDDDQEDSKINPPSINSYSKDAFPMMDAIANQILMHRNAHFGGKFIFMLEHYESDGIGCDEEIELSQIQRLAELEKQMGQDLGTIILSSEEHEKVKTSQKLYQSLRKIHSVTKDHQSIPALLADLILTETRTPTKVIDELVKHPSCLTYLIDLLTCDEFYDPLFPGYGRAPLHAASVLGQLKDPKAIAPLFQSIKTADFKYEEAMISALKKIEAPAYDFLMNVAFSSPITDDNELAAIALLSFDDSNSLFAQKSLGFLYNIEVFNHPSLAIQLILACLGLKENKEIEQFFELKDQVPTALFPDFQYVSSKLNKRRS